MGVARQSVQEDEAWWNHVRRQFGPCEAPEFGVRHGLTGTGDDEARQVLAVGTAAPQDDGRFFDRRVVRQRGLHLSQFNAQPVQVHLMIDAAEELQDAVGQPAGQVARPKSSPGVSAKGFGRNLSAVRPGRFR